MPSPIAIRPAGTLNSGSLAPGSVHPANATPNETVRALASSASRSTASRSKPASAAAPAILKTKMSPATPLPQRPRVSRRRARDVVGNRQEARVDALGDQAPRRRAKIQYVAGVIAEAHQNAAATIGKPGDAGNLLLVEGEAKTSPATAASASPIPT